MRHNKTGRKLGRNSSHRKAMMRNMVTSFFDCEKITTTDARAKELRKMAEKLITLARKGGLANFRRALAILDDKYVVRRLFREIAPRFKDRPGGYTRILHLPSSSRRLGDNAPQVVMELVAAGEAESSGGEEKASAQKAPPKRT